MRYQKLKQKVGENSRTVHGIWPASAKKLVQIAVKDTGCGIAPEQLVHIFDRYFQASNVQTLSAGGSGIGLEITKNYVELHQGSIMVSSQEGNGTTFYI